MIDFQSVDLAAIKKREQQVTRIMGVSILAVIGLVMTAAGLTVAGII
jgi:hypothetical protein